MSSPLAVIVVSTNEAKWLRRCLSSVYEHAGSIQVDVVVVDNESTDGTAELVRSEFPAAQVVPSENRGFSHANNRGIFATNARYILFLNPDTAVLEGTFENLIAKVEERPSVGLVGVKQVTPDGKLHPTIRRFPSVSRYWFEAFASERLPFRSSWLGERELELSLYDREVTCDWTSGSFMLARREALESAGYLDERFFIYSEEVDLCYRIRRAGWEIRHLPDMTILHHAGKAGYNARMTAQAAFARRQFMRKHFCAARRGLCVAALYSRHALRAVAPGGHGSAGERRKAARAALRVLAGVDAPPFGQPPLRALAPRAHAEGEVRLTEGHKTEGEGFEPSKSLHP